MTQKHYEFQLFIKISELISWNSTIKSGLKNVEILENTNVNDMITLQNKCFDLVESISSSQDAEKIQTDENLIYQQFIELFDTFIGNINFMQYWKKIFPQINDLTIKPKYGNMFIFGV